MRELLSNWKILLLISMLILSLGLITFKGISLGIDFKGGTMFQIELEREAESPAQLNAVKQTIQQRMDWTGLRDTIVTTSGDKYVIVQIAETDPEQVERMEGLLRRQGKFEATLDGEILFTGSDIIQIYKDSANGYGAFPKDSLVGWRLPFLLKEEAAKKFTSSVFHRCTLNAFDPSGVGSQYDCDVTYFFIDRPDNAVLILSQELYEADRQLLLQGNASNDIPADTRIEDLFENAALPYIVVGDNGLTAEQKSELSSLVSTKSTAIIPKYLPTIVQDDLESMGFKIKEVESSTEGYLLDPNEFGTQTFASQLPIPWVWQATGARQVISLTSGITNLEPYVGDVSQAKIFSRLFIEGTTQTQEAAIENLQTLSIILESGSLPIGVESISKETISPFLGQEFLQNVLFIGIVALIVVALVIYIRYRRLRLTVPIVFTGLSEVFIILGFAALINWNLDLAAVAGILAAVGTGVDDQIVITDELMKGEIAADTSLLNRVKRAFFIIMVAAATTIATMFPIVLFGFGLGKLVGFAIITITGVLIGVFIARPAYSEIARYIISKY